MFKLPIFVDFSACEVSVKRRCLVSGDYNSTELEFSFDKEYEGTKVFEMKSPSGELRMVKTITDNKIVLVGDNGASLFDEAGRYIFEISLYNGDSKLTSSSGFLLVDKEQVVIDGEIVEPFLPVFDELLNSVSEALEETSNLNIEAVKIGKTTTVTFTDKEGNTKEIEIKDGEDLPEYTFGNGLSKVGNNISVNTSTIATVTKAQELANSAYEDALADVEGEAAIRELKDAETLASAKDYTDLNVSTLNSRLNSKQDNLVSGTNIKTINGNNILGSGNIEIQGGGGSSYTFTDGVSESGGTVSADMEYIQEALYDSIGEIVDMTGTPRNNQIIIGASNTNPTIKASGKALTDLQDKLVSGTNIKTINGNSILGSGDLVIKSKIHAITTANTTVVQDATKGVSPYNTSYGYTNITINDMTEDELEVGMTLVYYPFGDLLPASAYRNVRIRFGENGAWKTFYSGGSFLTMYSYIQANTPRVFVYSDSIVSTGAFHVLADSNSTYAITSFGGGYGTCTTAAATTAKVGTLTSYTLVVGGVFTLKFTYGVPANSTLNVNSKGAKNIYYNGAKIVDGVINAGDVVTFTYDGTNYHIISNLSKIGGDGGGIPEIVISLEQMTSETSAYLNLEQSNILKNNSFVSVDASQLGMGKFGIRKQYDDGLDAEFVANVGIAFLTRLDVIYDTNGAMVVFMMDEYQIEMSNYVDYINGLIDDKLGVIENGSY